MSHLHLQEIIEHGRDAGRGNLLGIQPFMVTADYASGDAFHAKLAGYLDVARQRNWLGERTILVWPEHIGTWLAALGGGKGIVQGSTLAAAMRALILRHFLPFAKALLTSREADRVAAGLFRTRAAQMAQTYQAVFSDLARQGGATLVAGSIVLPNPQVVDGKIVVDSGLLYNTTAVFAPDGRVHTPLVRKLYPISSELPFTTPAPLDHLPVFDTPAGRLGVLICADCWYPAPYARLKAQHVDLIVVPSFLTGTGAWEASWGGYNGWRAPEDVDLTDVGRLDEAAAWRKYALAGRIASSGARAGLNVFLHGKLWDLGAEGGHSLAIQGETVIETTGDKAALLNLWV